MWKWILLGAVAFVLGGCLIVAGGIWWAMSSATAEPDFYAEVSRVELTEQEQEATLEEVKELAETVLPGFAREMQVREATSPAELPRLSDEPSSTDPPSAKTQVVELTEAQLNAYLVAAMGDGNAGPGLSDPRIRLADGIAQIGMRLVTPQFSGVVSGDIEVVVDGPKSITFQLERLALGRLAVPADQLLLQLQVNDGDLPEGVIVDAQSKPPRVTLGWDHLEQVTTEVISAEITDGRLRIELNIPEPGPIQKPETRESVDQPDAAAVGT